MVARGGHGVKKEEVVILFCFLNRDYITWLIVYVKDPDEREILICKKTRR